MHHTPGYVDIFVNKLTKNVLGVVVAITILLEIELVVFHVL